MAQDGSGDDSTITDAVAAAEDGDTIKVAPGTYIESLRIDEDITLRGDGPRENIVIAFTAESPTVPIHPGWPDEPEVPVGITLEGSDATIADLTITGPSPDLAIRVPAGDPGNRSRGVRALLP